jgi:hypothetical protein
VKALVVFQDQSAHRLAWLLRPGFRHVFICLLTEREGVGYWISIDPAWGLPLIDVQCGADTDLRAFYEGLGHRVIELERLSPPEPRWPWALANCVGVVKAVLGLKAPFVITPYQLFKRISRC